VHHQPEKRCEGLGASFESTYRYKVRYLRISLVSHISKTYFLLGSWMSSMTDSSDGREYTTYFVSIEHIPSNSTWQSCKRYAAIYDLHTSLSKEISMAFPSGMKKRFPGDRVKSWMFGLTDEVREQRGVLMDEWFQEMTSNQSFMLNLSAVKKIFNFFSLSYFD
jgi:PX domain